MIPGLDAIVDEALPLTANRAMACVESAWAAHSSGCLKK